MLRTLAEARTLMAQKDYLEALSKAVEASIFPLPPPPSLSMSTLTEPPSCQAARLCPCGKSTQHHPRDKSCHIREQTQAVRAFRFTPVGVPKCPCGFIWPTCIRPAHIDAVDVQAECSVKAGRHAAAFSIALGLIRLDPFSPAVRLSSSCHVPMLANSPARATVVLS